MLGADNPLEFLANPATHKYLPLFREAEEAT
jgi:hypothetical protein